MLVNFVSDSIHENMYPLHVPALRVEQPLGAFYVTILPAHILLDTACSYKLSAEKKKDEPSYKLDGTQRKKHETRLKEIGAYISTVEAAFPNSIILAPNFDRNGIAVDNEDSWRINKSEDANTQFELQIPTSKTLVHIVDGQHRLFGFSFCNNPERLNMELVCSIYMNIPKPFQAYLFATINSTQKRVDRSQTFELFGYNLDIEHRSAWSPDKLAVFMARKLNIEDDSPIKGKILIAAENDFGTSRSEARKRGTWVVSMATIVDGICKLISANVVKDRTELMSMISIFRRRIKLTYQDTPPFRSLYLESKDKLVYMAVKDFFTVVNDVFWSEYDPESYIFKTIGIQALFDILAKLAVEGMNTKDLSQDFFRRHLSKAEYIDFSKTEFKNASGSGRAFIRNCLFLRLGFMSENDIPEDKRREYVAALDGHLGAD